MFERNARFSVDSLMKVWPYRSSSSGGNVLLHKKKRRGSSCAVYNFSAFYQKIFGFFYEDSFYLH